MRASEFKKIQRLAGLENKDVAEILEVSVSLVEKWRTGKRNITNHTAFVICDLLEKDGFQLTSEEAEEIKSDLG